MKVAKGQPECPHAELAAYLTAKAGPLPPLLGVGVVARISLSALRAPCPCI